MDSWRQTPGNHPEASTWTLGMETRSPPPQNLKLTGGQEPFENGSGTEANRLGNSIWRAGAEFEGPGEVWEDAFP